MLCLMVMKAISLVAWHKGLISIATLIMSFYLYFNGCIRFISSSVSHLCNVSKLVHLPWWIPGPQIAVSTINNPNRNSFNQVEWDIFHLKWGMLTEAYPPLINYIGECLFLFFSWTRLMGLISARSKQTQINNKNNQKTINSRVSTWISNFTHKINAKTPNCICFDAIIPSLSYLLSVSFNNF